MFLAQSSQPNAPPDEEGQGDYCAADGEGNHQTVETAVGLIPPAHETPSPRSSTSRHERLGPPVQLAEPVPYVELWNSVTRLHLSILPDRDADQPRHAARQTRSPSRLRSHRIISGYAAREGMASA